MQPGVGTGIHARSPARHVAVPRTTENPAVMAAQNITKRRTATPCEAPSSSKAPLPR